MLLYDFIDYAKTSKISKLINSKISNKINFIILLCQFVSYILLN